MAALKLCWLGGPIVEVAGKACAMETRKSTALLVYISLREQAAAREQLAAMFWPEGDQKKAYASLRRTLSSLKSRLPADALLIQRDSIALDRTNNIWIDTKEFESLVREVAGHEHPVGSECADCKKRLETALGYYRGCFLEGFNLGDAPEFDEWQMVIRREQEDRYAWVLEQLGEMEAAAGNLDAAISLARRWVELDRCNEKAQRILMGYYVKAGQRNQALRLYQELRDELQQQLQQVPEDATTSLYEQIQGEGTLQGVLSPGMPLLKTKLYIPSGPEKQVKRTMLVGRLNEAALKPLTLISAPAGFGKSSLLTEWIRQSDLDVAWFSLDGGDNDPYRFLAYLVAAMEGADEAVGREAMQILRALPAPAPHIVLASLINDLVKTGGQHILVLDDYQVIKEHDVHEVMSYLLEHLPPNLKVMIATRSDPPLPLGRMRSRDELSELRAEDLRFTDREAEQFFNEVMMAGLTREEIEVLARRTEGWVAGMQMAALSLKGREDRHQFIRAFSGSHRFILDYLIEEVLGKQVTMVQDFLLESSILEQLCGPLCDTVLGEDWFGKWEEDDRKGMRSSQEVLEYLMRENLFIMALDDNHQWYRYHPLFADLLHARLPSMPVERLSSLHANAAEWLIAQQQILEAFPHCLLSGQYHQAAHLVVRCAPVLLARNELRTLLQWLDHIPLEIRQQHPWLAIYRAWTLTRMGILEKVPDLLSDAEKMIRKDAGIEDCTRMQGCIALVRALVANLLRDSHEVIIQAELADKLLTFDDPLVINNLHFIRGYAYYSQRDLEKARLLWQEVIQNAIGNRDLYTAANTWAELANLEKIQGHLKNACELYQQGLSWFKQGGLDYSPFTSVLEIGLADTYLEWGDLDNAKEYGTMGMQKAEKTNRPNTLSFGYLTMAKVHMAQGDFRAAEDALMLAAKIGQRYNLFPRAAILLKYELSKIPAGNQRLLADIERHAKNDFQQVDRKDLDAEIEDLCTARGLLNGKRTREALDLLDGLQPSARAGGRNGRLIEILLLQAMAHYQLGNHAEAFDALEECLQLAVPEGYHQIFLSEDSSFLNGILAKNGQRLPEDHRRYLLDLLGDLTNTHSQPSHGS